MSSRVSNHTKSQMFPPPKISQPSHFQIPSLREATILNSYERVSSFLSFFFYALLLQTSTAFRPFFDPSHSVAASETGRRNHFPLNHRATHASIDLHANAGAIVFRWIWNCVSIRHGANEIHESAVTMGSSSPSWNGRISQSVYFWNVYACW